MRDHLIALVPHRDMGRVSAEHGGQTLRPMAQVLHVHAKM